MLAEQLTKVTPALTLNEFDALSAIARWNSTDDLNDLIQSWCNIFLGKPTTFGITCTLGLSFWRGLSYSKYKTENRDTIRLQRHVNEMKWHVKMQAFPGFRISAKMGAYNIYLTCVTVIFRNEVVLVSRTARITRGWELQIGTEVTSL